MKFLGTPGSGLLAEVGILGWSISNSVRLALAVFIILATSWSNAISQDLPLYYYERALQARHNYENALLTNNPAVIKAYYEYALATHDDYIRSYQARHGRAAFQPKKNVGGQLPTHSGQPQDNLSTRLQQHSKTKKKPPQSTHSQDKGTLITLGAGFLANTNTSIRPDIIKPESDLIFSAAALLLNESTLSTGHRYYLRTKFNANAKFNIENSENSYDLFSLKAGPVMRVSEKWQISGLPFSEVNLLNYKYFSHNNGLAIALENTEQYWINEIALEFSREFFTKKYEAYEAARQQIAANLLFSNSLTKADELSIKPVISYIKARSSQYTYLNPGIVLRYSVPVAGSVRMSMLVSHFTRLYEGSEINVSKDRRDAKFVVSPSFIYSGFFFDSTDLTAQYRFVQNWSNEVAQDYKSHSVGLNVKWTY
ncbi:MAG: hypothetical protein CMM57_08145 [Rhodospirillaceae bacterium]|nr:hypothetical protein [Rhodospirillaceae bacterium]